MSLRIALLTHSTNPRGGVVHAMELATALQKLGHEPVLHAPDSQGRGFFRRGGYEQVSVPGPTAHGSLHEMVEQRIDDYLRYFGASRSPRFDVYHAQDSISANALARLKAAEVITGFVRTVHHLDQFRDFRLQQLQDKVLADADETFCVSRLWQQNLRQDHGILAALVPSGVDTQRFNPRRDPVDDDIRLHYGAHGRGPLFLSIGGVEPRKNSIRILRAFNQVLKTYPEAQLLIAGGSTVLDHGKYVDDFMQVVTGLNIPVGPGRQLILAGRVGDEEVPALYRIADALIFPSLSEGFGLVVLEAMASGTPVITSRIAPFTEHLPAQACLWVEPESIKSIATAMLQILKTEQSEKLRDCCAALVSNFNWIDSAQTHLNHYQRVLTRSTSSLPPSVERTFAHA